MEETKLPRGGITNFFEELNRKHNPAQMEIRGENAWNVSVKFMDLLRQSIPDPEDQKKLITAWLKAVRDNDYRKFKRALNKHRRVQNEGSEQENEHET